MSSPCVAAARIPVASESYVWVIIRVCLILTCGTECTDDVVCIRCTIAVLDNDPNARISVSIGYVLSNLEQLVVVAVQEGCSHDVIGFVHTGLLTVDGCKTVEGCVSQSTKVNHGWIGRR